jgi:putative FmdB family regulatory protein
MPTYDFKCPKGHEFERRYGTISGAPSEVPCPECGAVAVRQVSGGAGLVFKGSGFYLTDYGKNAHRGERPTADKKADEKAGKSSDKTSDKTSDKKTESAKTESKPESKEPKAGPAEAGTPREPKAKGPKPKSE